MRKDKLLVCDETCWRYKTRQNSAFYARHACYAGSSEGRVVTKGGFCIYNFSENSGIDTGTMEKLGELEIKGFSSEQAEEKPICNSLGVPITGPSAVKRRKLFPESYYSPSIPRD